MWPECLKVSQVSTQCVETFLLFVFSLVFMGMIMIFDVSINLHSVQNESSS